VPEAHFSEETLMAFVDGELDGAAARAIEQAMMEDRALSRRVIDYWRSRRVAKTAMSDSEALAVPPALLAAVSELVRQSELAKAHVPANENPRRYASLLVPLAASLAVIAAGSAGYIAGSITDSGRSAGMNLFAQLDSHPVANVLSHTPSGREETVGDGQVRVTATYRTEDKLLCREFTFKAPTGRANAVSCRAGDEWKVAFALRSADASQYIPADGSNLLADYVRGLGAGEPLQGDAELQALARRP
jgi:hypothetical protein